MTTTQIAARRVARHDEQLMERVARGSADALAELYNRYAGPANRVAWAVCRETGRAEDAVQEAFISIWRNPATYRPQKGLVSTWLLTVVRYRAYEVASRNGNHASRRACEDGLVARRAPGDVAEQAVTRADAGRLHTLLARLPAPQREVIALAFYGELSHTEIASLLDLPTGTVKGRMRLGLQKLRADIQTVVA